MTHFDPDKWLTSLQRSLESYMATKLVDDVYEIVADYPDPAVFAKRLPLPKTLVHISTDKLDTVLFGLGNNMVDDRLDETTGEIERWEARCHEVTFDLGIWASAETGGSTSRMEAREEIDALFFGTLAQAACLEATDGVDVRSISGGRSVQETIGDFLVYRMVDIALVVYVYSRVKTELVPIVEDLGYDIALTIDDDLTIS